MKWSNSAVALIVLLLIFAALMLRDVEFPAYSQAELKAELSALCDQYGALRRRGATEAQWLAFEQEAEKKLEPLVAELKRRGGSSWLSQLALHELPKAIASRGKRSDLKALLNRDEEQRTVSLSYMTPPQRAQSREGSADKRVDVWLIGMIVLDVGLLVAIGYMLFWPAHKRFSWRPKDVESTLQRLNQRIERNPDVVRFLATRARLLADSGRPEEAIADIDRILEQGTRGVDLEKWRQLRAKLARKATEKTAR